MTSAEELIAPYLEDLPFDDRIFPVCAADDTPRPYVVYRRARTEATYCLGGRRAAERCEMRVEFWAIDAAELAEVFQAVLDNVPYQLLDQGVDTEHYKGWQEFLIFTE